MSAHLLPQRSNGARAALLPRRTFEPRIAAWLGSLGRRIILGLRVLESRRMLRQLDARMLSDIGISRGDAEAEAGRMPWDLPRDWPGDWPVGWDASRRL